MKIKSLAKKPKGGRSKSAPKKKYGSIGSPSWSVGRHRPNRWK
jgi:hypothetical protein